MTLLLALSVLCAVCGAIYFARRHRALRADAVIELGKSDFATAVDEDLMLDDATELLEDSDLDLPGSSPLPLFDPNSPLHAQLVCGAIQDRTSNAA